ncbi:MAG: lytic transglycosylase domain-containing protein [Bacillota bacterium]
MPIPYRNTIFREAANTGIDGFLLAAMVKTESNFEPGAVSVKGARGLMQIMPETGRWVAGRRGMPNYSPDLLFNPEYNIKIGSLYVAELYKEYNGDTVLVLAAYNAGHGNVNKWIEEDYWTGKRGNIDQIPFPETRQFIRKVLFYQQAYRYLYNTDTGEKN